MFKTMRAKYVKGFRVRKRNAIGLTNSADKALRVIRGKWDKDVKNGIYREDEDPRLSPEIWESAINELIKFRFVDVVDK